MASSSKAHLWQGTDWLENGLFYHSLRYYVKRQFGQSVRKISLDAGLGCPNRDGTVGQTGCIFCDPASFSPSRRPPIHRDISTQVAEGVANMGHRADAFLAYLQPGTNTYAPVDVLRPTLESALAHEKVVGLLIGTRPDCVPEEVLDLLAEFAQRTWLQLELGLQSIHDRSLRWCSRGHDYETFRDAFRRSRSRGLRIGVHLILGIPGESPDDMHATADAMAELEVDAVKLHNLHVVRGTPLADHWDAGRLTLPTLEQYAGYVVDFLERLPPETVIDRIGGDAPADYLLAPAWCSDKAGLRMAIEAEFGRRGSHQGSRHLAK